MRGNRSLIFFLLLVFICSGTALAQASSSPAAPDAAAVAATSAHGDAPAAGHAKKVDGHWTLFNLLPLGWTYTIAVKVGGVFGIPASQIDPHAYNVHGLLHVMVMFLVLVLITLISVTGGRRYRKMLETGDFTPRDGVSVGNFVETIVKAALGMMNDIIGGKNVAQYLPLIGTLTFVILLSNLLGVIPGFYTASDNLNTTLSLALVVFFLYHYYGIKTHGLGKYLAHFMGPLDGKLKYIMAPIMVPIELISHFARPMSLSLRLFGNMFGDHKVFAVFMGLTALPFLYPLPFLALGLLVAVVQTLVFVLLTMVYIGLATAESH